MVFTPKELPSTDVTYKRRTVMERSEIPALLSDALDGLEVPPDGGLLVLVDFGAIEGGIDVRVGIPAMEGNGPEGWERQTLDPVDVLATRHEGDYSDIRDTYLRMYDELRARGLLPQTRSREVVHRFDPEDPEATIVEIQWPLHDWTCLLAEGVEETLGPDARDRVMEGVGSLTPGTTREDRFEWVRAALLRLEGVSTEEQRYWAVSPCADRYPAWRIEKMRGIYGKTGSVDQVLEEMKGDTEWYSTPYREGNLVYHTKVPYDREAWESAEDRDARRRAYCHCALVHDRLDETPPTYCYCGTGWVRQVWEGVFERPVRVEILKSLPAGDDECQFLIHLPEDSIEGGD